MLCVIRKVKASSWKPTIRPNVTSSRVDHTAIAEIHMPRQVRIGSSCFLRPCCVTIWTETNLVSELTADLNCPKCRDPPVRHSVVVSFESVRAVYTAETTGPSKRECAGSAAFELGNCGAKAGTYMNSQLEGVDSTTWLLNGMIPEGSLPCLKACVMVGQSISLASL